MCPIRDAFCLAYLSRSERDETGAIFHALMLSSLLAYANILTLAVLVLKRRLFDALGHYVDLLPFLMIVMVLAMLVFVLYRAWVANGHLQRVTSEFASLPAATRRRRKLILALYVTGSVLAIPIVGILVHVAS